MHLVTVARASEVDPPARRQHIQVLVLSRDLPARMIEPEFYDISVPLISDLLVHYAALGAPIETGTEWGPQISAEITILYRGQKRSIKGALVPLIGRSGLVLPLAFLSAGY